MLRTLALALLFVAVAAVGRCYAQGRVDSIQTGITTEGTEFWVVFQKNFRDFTQNEETKAMEPAEPLELQLFITSSKTATGYIEIRGLRFRKDFQVRAGEVITIPIDSSAQLRSSETVEELGVHIVSDEPIAVYGLSHRFQTTDTYLAYPVSVLGKEYLVMGYGWLANDLLSQFAIIATEDNTRISISPTIRTQKGRPPGTPFTISLDRGQAYQVIPRFNPASPSDLTGSRIESDKPIAVFSGHNCAYVPDNTTKACNILVEQIPALQSWGRQFFVGTMAGRSSYVLRILAANDDTEVFENNLKVATLNAGEFYENKKLKNHTMITSSKPVLLAQFSKGFADGVERADSVGDPMMIVVAPTEQFLSNYRFATPIQGSWHHYINVIAPTASLRTMMLDGQPMETRFFRQFGLSRYSIAQIEVPYGTHTISGADPFGLYSYGFGYAEMSYDAYGNGGGQSMIQVFQEPDTIPPGMDANYSKGIKLISAVARDDRLNDKGIDDVVLLDYDNLRVTIAVFEPGAPQVPITIRPIESRLNAYARFRLIDRAGNISTKLICAKYDEKGDSMIVTALEGTQSCDFSPSINIGGYLKYSAINNNVAIAAQSPELKNPVELKGNHGDPAFGLGTFVEYPYSGTINVTVRAGFDFWDGDAFGYWPDSLANRATDGTPIAEEFQLHRSTFLFTLSPDIQYFPFGRKYYAFGSLNISLPLVTTETMTRTVLAPSTYTYASGERREELYSGGDPGGFGLALVPEIGIGASVALPHGLMVFGELGAGTSLFSISPDRDWGVNYLFGRTGAKIRF